MASNGVGGSMEALRSSVVKIFVRSVGDNFASPWKKQPQQSSTGSGLCIDRGARRVLTNAHVVSDAVSVRVRKHGDSVQYPAVVLCTSSQCDLALLEVRSDSFWEAVATIELNEEIPALDSDVLTIGYPMGGDNISVTRGVVSRVDLMDYTFSPVGGERLPVIQVDAAINSGNSGGPVLDAQGRAIGVAFAGLRSGENIGYVIPGSVALFFLRGYAAAGRFEGLCSLGTRVQSTQSAAMRRFFGLDGVSSGVLITAVAPLSPAEAAGVREGDVLISVDGVAIAEDATVPFRADGTGERIGFDFLVSRKAIGENIKVVILRGSGSGDEGGSDAKERLHTLDLRAAPIRKLVPRIKGIDAQPSYLVVGGLVFVTLTLPWLQQRFSRSDAPPQLLQKLEDFREFEGEEVVVLAKVLAAEVNYGFDDFSCLQLLEFGAYTGGNAADMVKIRSLRHLRDLVTVATRANVLQSCGGGRRGAFMRFRLAGKLEVVLATAECEAAREEILRQHAIPRECSEDLLSKDELQQEQKLHVTSSRL